MHHDKLKICESRKLPKWLVDFQGTKDRRTSNIYQSSKVSRNDQCVGDSLKPKLKGMTDQASLPDGPYRGTRSKTKAVPPLEPSHKRQTSEGKTKKKHYCLCKQVNPKGMMVQCDECRDCVCGHNSLGCSLYLCINVQVVVWYTYQGTLPLMSDFSSVCNMYS